MYVYYVDNVLNILFHVDLIFNPHVLYFQFINVTAIFDHAFIFTTVGVPNFFNGFNTQYMVDLGCAVAGYLNATVLMSEFLVDVGVTFASTPINSHFPQVILTYISNYNLQTIINSVNGGTTCLDNFLTMIDKPIGHMFTYLFRAVGALITLIVSMISNIGPDFANFLANDVVPQLDIVIENLQIMSLAIGNFFRQFQVNGCTLLPARIQSVFGPFHASTDPFCCFGGFVQAVLVALLQVIKIVIDSIQYLVNNFSDFEGLLDNVLNLQTNLIPVSESAISSVACMMSFFFSTTGCSSGTGTIQSSFDDFFTTAANFTLTPLFGANLVLKGLREALNGTFTFDQVACDVFTGLYDLSIGNFCNMVRAGTYLLGCLVGGIDGSLGTAIYDLGNAVWEGFGWPSGEVRGFICTVIDVLSTIVEFFIEFIKNPANAIYNLILPLLNDIIDVINDVICPIEEVALAVYSGATQTWTCLDAFFTVYLPWILGCIDFDHDGDCEKLSSFPCVPPNFDLQPCPKLISPLQPVTRKEVTRPIPSDEIRDVPAMNVTIVFQIFNYTIYEEGHPCSLQYELLNEAKGNNVTTFLMQRDLYACLFSAAMARILEIVLTNDFNMTVTTPIVDPEMFYDLSTFSSCALSIFYGAREGFYYETTAKGQNVTWEEFVNETGLDRIPLRYYSADFVMRGIEDILRAMNATSINVFSGFWQDILNVLERIQNAYINVKARSPYLRSEQEGGTLMKRALVEQRLIRDNITDYFVKPLNMTVNWISGKMDNFTSFLSDKFFSSKGTRAIKNRNALIHIWNVIQIKITKGYQGRTRNQCPFDSMGKRSCGPVDLCIDGKCLQCAVVEQLVDVFVEGICNCINRSQNGIPTSAELTNNQTITNYKRWDQMDYREEEYHSYESRYLINTTVPNAVKKIGTDVDDFLIGIIDKVISWIFPSYGGTSSYTSSLGNFFTNTNSTDTHSILFWLKFFSPAGCDIDTMVEGTRGLGIKQGLIWTLLFYTITLVVGTILFSPIQSLGLILLPFAFSVFMATSYLMAPGCLFPTPLPLLPYPFADDLYKLYTSWNADCVNWDSFLPGITSPTCPTSSTDFTRDFVDCAAEPYFFVDGIRNIFFYIQWKIPGFSNFLQDTEVPIVSWIREIPFLEDRLAFDFGPTGMPNDTWISCNKMTEGQNLYTILIGLLAPIVLIFFFLPAVIAALSAAVTVFTIIVLALVEVVVVFTGTLFDRDNYFKDERELPRHSRSNTLDYSTDTLEHSSKTPLEYSKKKKEQ
jgi:hypothetical protein